MQLPSIIGSEPTPRVAMLKDQFLARQPWMCCDRAVVYTEVYQKYRAYPVVHKRAIALRETLSRMPVFIEPGEILMGHPASRPRAAEVFPEINMAFMDDLDGIETREHNRLRVTEDVKDSLRAIWPYWRGKTLTEHFRVMRPPELQLAVDTGLISCSHEWSSLAHIALDYRKILEKGFEGLRADAQRKMDDLDLNDPEYAVRVPFYRACLEVVDGALIFAERHRALALEQAAAEPDAIRRAELEDVAATLARVPRHPARTFREAVQSFYLVQLIPQIEANGYSITPGRIDQFLWPYLRRDLSRGDISQEEAQELVDMLFLKFCEIMRVDSRSSAEINAGYASGQNVAVGGVDEHGDDASNLLSYICLKANSHVRLHQPNFTVLLHKNTPAEFLAHVVESVACGNGMPQLLNDDLIVRSLVGRGFPPEEARAYIPVGCDEVTLYRHWGRCNGGYVNFAKALEATLGNGEDFLHRRPVGLPLDAMASETFGDFLSVYDRQLARATSLLLCETNLADHIHKAILPLPFVSLFVDDCLENGRDVTAGGARLNTSGPIGVGTATVADSLQAIRTLAFEERKLTLPQYRELLERDFEGDEYLRQYIINRIPKFGNDVDDVDNLAAHVTNVYFDEVESRRNYRGGEMWPALLSVSAQISLGNETAATPDGRLAREPLSDGLTPMYGVDVSGPTACLKSLAKIDQGRALNGVIANQRLTRSLFQSPQGRGKLAQLFRAFVDLGSFHWQFNIVDNETLLKAQESPDEYRSLVVRVAGYSAIFTELSRKAQDSIIARYESGL